MHCAARKWKYMYLQNQSWCAFKASPTFMCIQHCEWQKPLLGFVCVWEEQNGLTAHFESPAEFYLHPDFTQNTAAIFKQSSPAQMNQTLNVFSHFRHAWPAPAPGEHMLLCTHSLSAPGPTAELILQVWQTGNWSDLKTWSSLPVCLSGFEKHPMGL